MFHRRPTPLLLFAFTAFPLAVLAQPFEVSGERKDVQVIREANQTYTIPMGGTADMDNTATRRHETWDVGSLHDITWTKTGTIGNVKIEYTTNGTDYTTIIPSVLITKDNAAKYYFPDSPF